MARARVSADTRKQAEPWLPPRGVETVRIAKRSRKVRGCGLVTAGVTPAETGFVPLCDLAAHRGWPRPGWRSWPDQELDRLALAAPGVSHHSPAEPCIPEPEPRPVQRRRERNDQSDRSA